MVVLKNVLSFTAALFLLSQYPTASTALRPQENNIFSVERQNLRLFYGRDVRKHFDGTTALPILYESNRILAINKPAGISHHDNADNDEPGILSVVRQQQSEGAIVYQGRLYGVHRLDRVTSGILLLAKDQDMASILATAFREGTVTKYYTGLSVKSRPTNKKQGWVKGNMVRGRRKSWYLTREPQGNNYAVTRFFTAGLSGLTDTLVASATEAQPKTLILFRPLTGRTHQLRVAAKSVGLPLQGDPIYSDGEEISCISRTYLHATGLHVDLGQQHKEIVTIWSSPPFGHLWSTADGFEKALERLVEKHCTDCSPLLERASCSTHQ